MAGPPAGINGRGTVQSRYWAPECNACEAISMSEMNDGESAATAEDCPSYCDPSYVMPKWHDVMVHDDTGEETTLRVYVEKATGRKPYLGGYRHKETGVTYHHASSQSVEHSLIPLRRPVENLRNRDTQTRMPAP